MSEISDMHVEAYAAGLDPSEMDGDDWAEFLSDDNEPLTDSDEDAARMFVSECQSWMCAILMDRAPAGETIAQATKRLFPHLSDEQTSGFESFLVAIKGTPEFED